MNDSVIIGMSGGVDSAVSALLLKETGYDVHGVTLSLCSKTETAVPYGTNSCCSLDEIDDAKRVAERLSISHDVIDFSDEFRFRVIDNFINAYKNGKTPNPCIECNKHIKFKKMLSFADEHGIGKIATGHYAIVEKAENGRMLLKKAKDSAKDQTYVLYNLTQDNLKRILFPLGNMTKSEVRELADANGFSNAHKRDSQDICFVPDGDYARFIESYTGETFPEGNFVDLDGNILGRHNGIIRYTIGQRKGLGIAFGKPMFVCRKNISENTVVIGDNESLFSRSLDAHSVNLIACDRIDSPIKVTARVRYNQLEQAATVVQTDTDKIHVEFDQPQRAISSGQSVVLYDGDIVIGGGIIN